MCPACLTTAALVATGATSAGGLNALAVAVLRGRTGASGQRGDRKRGTR